MSISRTVLIIEDNKADYELLKEALERVKDIDLTLFYLPGGQEGLRFVNKTGEFSGSPTPDLIILDLNLPTISGFEILKLIKNNPKLKSIPVIIYSTSTDQQDINQSYDLQANSYVAKEYEIQSLFDKIAILGNFWLKTAKIPERKE